MLSLLVEWLLLVAILFCHYMALQPTVDSLGSLLMRIRDNLFEVDTCLAIKYMTRVTPLDKRIGFKRNLDNVCLCCCLP